jgi:hypothetical protein
MTAYRVSRMPADTRGCLTHLATGQRQRDNGPRNLFVSLER